METKMSQIVLFCFLIGLAATLPLFDLSTCHNMCMNDMECPKNAVCVRMFNRQCGICSCLVGFHPSDGECVSENSVKSDESDEVTSTETPFTETTSATENSTKLQARAVETATTTTGTTPSTTTRTTPRTTTRTTPRTTTAKIEDVSITTTSAPSGEFRCPKPRPECQPNKTASESNPFVIPITVIDPSCIEDMFLPTVGCNNLRGGNSGCAGGSQCLADGAYNVCICAYGKAGSTCRNIVPNERCENGPSRLRQLTRFIDRRYISQTNSNTIYARYFVPDVEHCAKLCEWAGSISCGSFNIGIQSGRLICELLSITTSRDPLLAARVVPAEGWNHYCCYRERCVGGTFHSSE